MNVDNQYYSAEDLTPKATVLKPDFSDLTNPATILKHVEELTAKKPNAFPVDVFPEPVQEIIEATNSSLNFPIDFIGASMLYAVSVSVGNTYRIEIKKGWQESAVLYLALVGRAGTAKSHPLSFALNPLEKLDGNKYRKYLEDLEKYEAIMSLTKKEREKQGIEEPIPPMWEQYLVTDFTPEALADVHKCNRRGIGVYVDELASWVNNFNRYNKGSEEQFWLSVWSGKPIRINRKTSGHTYIPVPFISVAGTIQPGVLNNMAENRTENGFLDRLLFVVPDNLKKDYWSETELHPVYTENWQNIISSLLDIPINRDESFNPIPGKLSYSPEAKQILFDWQRTLTDQSNAPGNEAFSGILAKMEMYAARLSLCLEMLRFACGESELKTVGIEAVNGAIKLVEYFKNTAFKVHSEISNTSPLDRLPGDKQSLYNALPDQFTTSEGLQIAQNMKIPERTFKRFLSNRDLFNNLARGEYEKLF